MGSFSVKKKLTISYGHAAMSSDMKFLSHEAMAHNVFFVFFLIDNPQKWMISTPKMDDFNYKNGWFQLYLTG